MPPQQTAEAVFALSQIDVKLLRLHKQLDELPQRAQILALRRKVKELEHREQQVDKLAVAAERALRLYSDETERNAYHIADTQAALNKVSEYRETAILVSEMEQLAKRKTSLEEDILAQMERQEKAADVKAQLAEAKEKLAAEEELLIAAYREQGGSFQQEIADLQNARDTLAATLPSVLATRYRKAVQSKGGVGAAHLEGNQCSGCHSTLGEGQIAKLVEGDEVGECPNCNRIMVTAAG